MNRGRAILAGVLMGCLAAVSLSSVWHRTQVKTSPTALSECSGAIDQIVIQYVAGTQAVAQVYKSFLSQAPNDIKIWTVCPEQTDFDDLIRQTGSDARLIPVLTHTPLTPWARDRWIARQGTGGVTSLLAPAGEKNAEVWEARAGDAQVASKLADVIPATDAQRSSLYFDAGDVFCTDNHAFATSALIERNPELTRHKIIAVLEHELGMKVTLLDPCPPHHAGMFMMAAGDRTMLVADPRLWHDDHELPQDALPGGPDFSPKTLEQFDRVAEQVAAAGFRVVRIPTLSAPDGKTYLTYLNALVEQRDGQRVVYMPVYDGVERMNNAAQMVWESLGYKVHRVDCTSTYRFFGNLHCLVNVLKRR